MLVVHVEFGGMVTTKIVCAAMGIAIALGWAPLAGADPGAWNPTMVKTESPIMTCMVGSATGVPAIARAVTCQSGEMIGFTSAPVIDPDVGMHQHQATITAAGELEYQDANLPMGYDGFDPDELSDGDVHHVRGWTVTPTSQGVTFTQDETGHGMTIHVDRTVTAF